MRIATMVRGYLPSPAPAGVVYAPIDLALTISQRLAQKGHIITYFAPDGSTVPHGVQLKTKGLRPLAPSLATYHEALNNIGYASNNTLAHWDQFLAKDMFERARAGEFDLLHFHHPEVALAYAPLYPDVPVVYTLHNPITDGQCELLNMHQSSNQHLISISDSQRCAHQHLPYAATVYNGIDTEQFSFNASGGDYFLFAGRLVPEKGAHVAIKLARQLGVPLKIIGPLFDDHKKYFNTRIKPYLTKKITYEGNIPHDEIATYFRNAKAFLMPISWEEPFGLTMVEAMACGTPVIAFRRGSVPEVVAHGKTGFVVDTAAQMKKAMQKIDTIMRADCRTHAEEHFSITKMVEGYEQTFLDIITQSKSKQLA